VHPHIQFNQHVSCCSWNKVSNMWEVTIKEGTKISANILISGSGTLHVPHTPKFEGSEVFEGTTMHTAKWDKNWDPSGRKVAIIGTGASAVQAIPELAVADIEHLYVFQRTPCWSPKRGDFLYPEWMKTLFKYFPLAMKLHRALYFWRGELLFHSVFTTDRFYNKLCSNYFHKEVTRQIEKVVKDPDVAAKLTPTYEIGCKRITPSDNYLPAFNKPNVELVTDSIELFVKDGIKTKKDSYEVDTIIYATGFDLLAGCYAYELLNKHGVSSKEEFGDVLQGYLGICHPNYPNFFWLLGPGTGLGTNTVIYMIECQADYTVDCIKKMVAAGAKSMTVKSEVNEKYQDWSRRTMKERVFGGRGTCNAWYKNNRGNNWTLWPSDLVTYWLWTRSCSWEEFDKMY